MRAVSVVVRIEYRFAHFDYPNYGETTLICLGTWREFAHTNLVRLPLP
jgi:hypothetical protein